MQEYVVEKAATYYEQIYNSIKQMIFNGVLKPGEIIHESNIAKQFQISRSPVREAIRSLEKEGLLVINNKSRITIYEPTIKDVEEIYECRQALESFAVRLTAHHASEEELKKIEGILLEAENALNNMCEDSAELIISLNAEFHDLILGFTRNSRLQNEVNSLKSLTNFYRRIVVQDKQRYIDILNQHKEIFHSIRERDEERASTLMINHISKDLDNLKLLILNQNEKER